MLVLIMFPVFVLVLCTVLQSSKGDDLSFPPDFEFGAATSSYQVEGAWNDDGKGENIWDRFTHEHPEYIVGNDTGDVATDSYHLWREDVKAAAQSNLQFYRFSISWSRIFPTGYTNEVNEAGVEYYNKLIDGLLAEGIQPLVTLYHWDLPVKIQDIGGWTNPLIVNIFGRYARIVYSLFGDRVKHWLTLNEPHIVCDYFYGTGTAAPGIHEIEFAPYLCNKYMLLAHALAYRIYDQEFRQQFEGQVSLAVNIMWYDPATPKDRYLTELANQHQTGRFTHPIFSKTGGWPPIVESWISKKSQLEGHHQSRLPSLTRKEKDYIRGTADFIGVNYYTSNLVRPATIEEKCNNSSSSIVTRDLDVTSYAPPGSKYGALSVFPVVPQGLRKAMVWLKQQYGDLDILITENGYSTSGYDLEDYERIDYIKEHLKQILLAIKVNKINVIGYTAWSLIDNFEWSNGYGTKFGLYEIDYTSPNLTRTPRLSSKYYGCVIQYRSLDVPDFCWNTIDTE